MAEPEDNRKSERPVMTEVSATGDGKDLAFTFASQLLASDDSILRSKGRGDLELYEKLHRDDQVKSTFQQRRLAVTSKEWIVSPGGDSPIDEEAADHLRDQLDRIGFDRITDKMLFGVLYGYAVSELIYGVRDNKFIINAIRVRKARRFRFDKQRKLRLISRSKPDGIIMPDRKMWVFSTGADNDDEPYGLGLGHFLYWPVFFKRHGLKFWLIYMDKFGMPTALGKFPSHAEPKDRDTLLKALRAISTDAGIAIPEGMEIELLEAARASGGDYDKFYDRMDLAISKIVLSQTMTTDSGSSLSQAQVHGGVKEDVIKSDADLLCESFNCGPARWVTEWNFPGAETPIVRRLVSECEDLNAVAERDEKLSALGFVRTDESFSEIYGDGYVRKEPSPDTVDDNQDTETVPPPEPEFAEGADVIRDVMDDLAIAALEDEGWVEPMDGLVGPVLEALENAKSPSEFKDNLIGLLDKMDITGLQKLLAESSFFARISARLGVDDK